MTILYEALGKNVLCNSVRRPGVWHLSRSACTVASLHLRRGPALLGSTPQFSQFLATGDKLSKAAIQADQQGSKSPNRGRHKVFRTGEVDVKFRLERALID